MSRSGQPDVLVCTDPMAAHGVFDTHVHDRHQLATSVSGVLSIHVVEQTWILPPSRALWIPAGIPHATAGNGTAVLRSAYIDVERCPIRWTVPTPVVADDVLVALVARLANDDLPPAQRGRTLAVLHDALRPSTVTTISTPLPVDPRARAVAEGLLARPADPRSLDQWGRSVGASARTLTRCFAADTGMTFGQWRTAARIASALAALAAGRSVSSTAREVGYETPSAFVAAFRRELGTTPAAYFAGRATPVG